MERPVFVMHASKSQPTKESGNKRLRILIVLVAVGGAAFLVSRFKDEPPPEVDTKRAADIKGVFAGGVTKTRVNSKPAETRGAFAADEMIQITGKAGSVVIVKETPGPMMSTSSDMARFLSMISAEVEAFKDRLQDKGRFSFLPELALPRPDSATRTVWPAGALTQLLQRTPPQATIVAFCQLPAQFTEAEKALLRSRPGKVVVVAGAEPEMRPLVEQKLVHLAITSRLPVPPATVKSETPTQWVMRVHTVLKP